MKKALFIIPAAAMFILAGCQKAQTTAQSAEPQQQTYGDDLIYIGIGGFDSPTKVTADLSGKEVTFSFEVGDEVAFVNSENTSDVSILKCITLIEDETTHKVVKAGFTQISGSKVDGEDTQKKYKIYYPKEAATYTFGDPFWEPWNEKYVQGNLPREHMIYSEEALDYTHFSLNKHVSVIHFQVKGTAKINKVEFSEFYPYPKSGGEYLVSAVLDCGEGVQLSNEIATDFYIDAIMSADNQRARFKLSFYGEGNQLIKEQESTQTTILKTNKFYDFIGEEALIIINPLK